MAVGQRISEMDDAAELDGTEQMEVVQGGANLKTTSASWLRITQIATAWIIALAALGVGWSTLFAKTSDYAENPVGIISEYAGVTAPAGWLLCQGQELIRTGTYAALYAVIGTTWGVGNGTTTFNAPDMREASPYGAGTWTTTTGTTHGAITAHDAHALGAFADDQFQGHRMAVGNAFGGGGANTFSTASGGTFVLITRTGDPVTDETNGTPRTGTTTRGKLIGVNYIIKY